MKSIVQTLGLYCNDIFPYGNPLCPYLCCIPWDKLSFFHISSSFLSSHVVPNYKTIFFLCECLYNCQEFAPLYSYDLACNLFHPGDLARRLINYACSFPNKFSSLGILTEYATFDLIWTCFPNFPLRLIPT
mgnify:CR=1 FL=1